MSETSHADPPTSVPQHAGDGPPGPDQAAAPAGRKRTLPTSTALLVFLAAEIVFFSIQSPYFFNLDNWLNILTALAITGVLAAGVTVLLIAGQVDLSVGSGVAFVGLILVLAAPTLGLGTAILLAVAAGIAIGLLNGFLVTVVGINSLITTLGTLAILRGLTLVVGGGQNIPIDGFDFAIERPLGVPVPALVFVAVAVVVALLLRYTVFGRRMYAIGANPIAARLVGIRVNRNLFVAFAISGLCIALAGLLSTSQLGSTSGTTGGGLELAVVTAVILGGASLSGGVGGVLGTVIGLLIVGVLNNGLTLMNVDSAWQQVATGALLIVAVAFDRLRQNLFRSS